MCNGANLMSLNHAEGVERSSAVELLRSNEALREELKQLRRQNGDLMQRLVMTEAGSQLARESHRAALNLMEDALDARRAEQRENAERRRIEEELRASEERQAFLLTLSDALRPLVDPAEVQAAACQVLAERLGVDRVNYSEIEPGGEYAVVRQAYSPILPDPSGRYDLADFPLIIKENRSGKPFVSEEVAGDPRLGCREREALACVAIQAIVSVPLVKEGRLVAQLAAHTPNPRLWRADEIALVVETAERTWSAVERAKAEEALREARDGLEEKVAVRTAELEEALDRRAELSRRLATAQEDERCRISRELHDVVGQLVAGLSLTLKAFEMSSSLPSLTVAKLAEARRLADTLGKEVHALAVRLRPTALDDLGLQAALGQLATEWSSRTEVRVDLHTTGLDRGRLTRVIETTVYRVVQEALNNVAKHAQASVVSIVVRRSEGEVTAMVEDDGIGFDPGVAATGRIGVIGMRERAALVGGEIDIESRRGSGTTVVVRIPEGRKERP